MKLNFWSLFRRRVRLGNDHDRIVANDVPIGAGEILLKGSSKVTREELAQIPADRKAAFINEVAMRLRITKRRTR
jgi:hypothetical protein